MLRKLEGSYLLFFVAFLVCAFLWTWCSAPFRSVAILCGLASLAVATYLGRRAQVADRERQRSAKVEFGRKFVLLERLAFALFGLGTVTLIVYFSVDFPPREVANTLVFTMVGVGQGVLELVRLRKLRIVEEALGHPSTP